MKILNKCGPSTDPCGTPDVSFPVVERVLPSLTHCVLQAHALKFDQRKDSLKIQHSKKQFLQSAYNLEDKSAIHPVVLRASYAALMVVPKH